MAYEGERMGSVENETPMFRGVTFSSSKVNAAARNAFRSWGREQNHIHSNIIKPFVIVWILPAGLIVSRSALCFGHSTAADDTAQKHLILDEIVVTGDAVTKPMGTEVSSKKIEKGKNITKDPFYGLC